jgi:hypothetical protein
LDEGDARSAVEDIKCEEDEQLSHWYGTVRYFVGDHAQGVRDCDRQKSFEGKREDTKEKAALDFDISTRNNVGQKDAEVFQIAVPPSCLAESLGARILDVLVFIIAVAVAVAVVLWNLVIVLIGRRRNRCLKKRVRILGALSGWSPELKWHDRSKWV